MPRRSAGNVGFIRVRGDGKQTEVIDMQAPLPTQKEELEGYFGQRFIAQFNSERPLGDDVDIGFFEQRGTEDLDYRIVCSKADYLELAECTPLSEPWGREAMETRTLDVYEAGRWVWQSIIERKAERYGVAVAHRTFLLLYSTHSELTLGDAVIDLLRSTLQRKGCAFAGVFYQMVLDDTSSRISMLAPWPHTLPPPRYFKGMKHHSVDLLSGVATANGITFRIPTG